MMPVYELVSKEMSGIIAEETSHQNIPSSH